MVDVKPIDRSDDITRQQGAIYVADASGGPITLTLPEPTLRTDLRFKKIDSSSNAVTLSPPGSATIDGKSSITLTTQYEERHVVSDGTELVTDAQQGMDSLSTEKGVIKSNKSVVNAIAPFQSDHTVVANDGTFYAVDGSELKKTSDPTDSWTVHGTLPFAYNTKNRDFHITANGTFLATDSGAIYRSSDGQNWSNVQSLDDAGDFIWSFSENSAGDIIASEYDNAIALWKSSDGGLTWQKLADGTDLSNFSEHIHKAKYSPVDNNWIVVTGGDAGTDGYYRSTDGGTTWDWYNPLGYSSGEGTGQFVGIGFHPTDKNTYFLGTDSSRVEGIVKISDDGSTVSIDHIQTLNSGDGDSVTSGGAFTVRTITTDSDHFYVTSSVDEEPDMVWASVGNSGVRWRGLVDVGVGWRQTTTSQGAGETVLDASVNQYVLAEDKILSFDDITNPLYGFLQNRYHGVGDTEMFAQGGGIWFGDFFLRTKADGNLHIVHGPTNSTLMKMSDSWVQHVTKLQPLGGIDLNENVLYDIKTWSNAASGDLEWGELAIDVDRGGTGTTALLYRDGDGTATHYWDEDGTL